MAQPVILVYDRGAFLPFATALTKDADVLFFSEFRDVASHAKNAMVGRDVAGMRRVDSFWSFVDEVDTIVFPDCGDGDLQDYLREHGYQVWGSGKAEMLELDRYQFRKLLESLDMPVIPYRHIVGLDDLKRAIYDETDLFIKSSWHRGDVETRGHKSWHRTEGWFNKLKHDLGPHGSEIEFVVEEKVDGVEIGFDGWSVDGMFPKHALWGIEHKDSSFLGRVQDVADMPACIMEVNEKMSEALQQLGMRGNFSTELRVGDDGVVYFIDPCCRAGSPPISCMSVLIDNWVEIVTGGARGEMVEGDFKAEYACEIELCSEMATKDWLPVEYPKELEPYVKLRRAANVDGDMWVIQHPWMNIIGAAVGIGNTPEAAIDAALAVAEQIDAEELKYDHNCKDELLRMWDEAEEACKDASIDKAA